MCHLNTDPFVNMIQDTWHDSEYIIHMFQVKVEALNDSLLICICLYNVFLLCSLGLTLNLALENRAGLIYRIISGIRIIGTTGTQLVVFMSEVSQLFGHRLYDAYITTILFWAPV